MATRVTLALLTSFESSSPNGILPLTIDVGRLFPFLEWVQADVVGDMLELARFYVWQENLTYSILLF